jgi:hypothetical protein
MTDFDGDWDPQDQAEVLDEDNQSLDGAGDASAEFRTFEELPDVYDVTTVIGDKDDQSAEFLDEADFDEDAIDEEDLEVDEDSPDEVGLFEDNDDTGELTGEDDPDDLDGVAELAPGEVELEYAGDMYDLEHARSSAKPYESTRELSDSDLVELGYKDEEGNLK